MNFSRREFLFSTAAVLLPTKIFGAENFLTLREVVSKITSKEQYGVEMFTNMPSCYIREKILPDVIGSQICSGFYYRYDFPDYKKQTIIKWTSTEDVCCIRVKRRPNLGCRSNWVNGDVEGAVQFSPGRWKYFDKTKEFEYFVDKHWEDTKKKWKK